ncbi:MAG TPA: DUF5683 domain-containing protein [Ignavibacteria bacterium]|nr:DUF5683 domain-containing protein [Ignavibacteria bacterium]
MLFYFMPMKWFMHIIAFCYFLPSLSVAQEIDLPPYTSLKSDVIESIAKDTLTPVKKTPKTFRMRKNPWVAVGLSAVIPGAGQFYNESYWKIPVILGAGGLLGYQILRNNDRYNEYKDLYEQSLVITPGGNPIIKEQRDNFRDQRDEFIIYFGLFYLINLVDAYVDAHLYDFDVSEEMRVSMMKGSELMKFTYTF